MRDYFLDFVSKQDEKIQKRPITEGAEDPFVPFAPSVNSEYPEIFADMRSENLENSYVPGNEIFEERIAIMMYGGGLGEAEAIQYLTANPPYPELTT
jgi:hypothetical protein